MANDVYTQTQDGLATLVSARAAQRVLDRALHKAGHTADSVSGGLMKRLLLGPVCRELEVTLPRDGLRRTLKKLAADLTRLEVAEARPDDPPSVERVAKFKGAGEGALEALEDDAPAPGGVPITFEQEQSEIEAWDDAPETSVPPPAVGAEHVRVPFAVYETPAEPSRASQPLPTPAPAPSVAPRRKTFPPLSDAQLEATVLRFAGLEEVKLVAAFGPGGEVVCSRGGGFDLAALARFGLMTLTLLRRNAHVRAYYLAHSLHQLFLLPLGGSTLLVIGTPDLNVGAVFGTLSVLEEEL